MNAVYGEFFQDDPPARAAVEVAALPLGGKVQIEAVAQLCECGGRGESCDCSCH
jgi:2-iminobutanoate/2-iminopropanoate deaminase